MLVFKVLAIAAAALSALLATCLVLFIIGIQVVGGFWGGRTGINGTILAIILASLLPLMISVIAFIFLRKFKPAFAITACLSLALAVAETATVYLAFVSLREGFVSAEQEILQPPKGSVP